jgi:hypothetical protein
VAAKKKKAAAPAKKTKDESLAGQLEWVKAAPKLSSAVDPKKLPVLEPSESAPPAFGGSATGTETTANVLRALASAKADAKLTTAIRKETTAESRDALGIALLEIWKGKDFHGRLSWIMDAVAGLGGDRAMTALASHVAAWPKDGDTGRKRAIAAAAVLANAGTDTSVLELMNLRQTAVVPSVLEATIEALDRAVRSRKTSLSELFDVVTPTLGLDQNGTRTFDHAGHTYTVAFDDHFEPRLRDAAGDLKDLDEEPAWNAIASQLRDAVKVQTFRLEQDMITGRRWSVDGWTRLLRDHPLMVSFTRRLVWGVYDENNLVTAFRTAEDRTLLTKDGDMKLAGDELIGLVHPLHLNDADRAAWGESLADYEIIQPFPQIGRPIHRLEDAEKTEQYVRRYATSKFKSGVLRDVLVRGGWERDSAFLRTEYTRPFVSFGVWAIATMDPGVQAGMATYDEYDQTIATIEFREKKGGGMSRTPMSLADVPLVPFSEAVRDLAEVLAAQD